MTDLTLRLQQRLDVTRQMRGAAVDSTIRTARGGAARGTRSEGQQGDYGKEPHAAGVKFGLCVTFIVTFMVVTAGTGSRHT